MFGHGPEVLTNATIAREFAGDRSGMRTVVWQQQLDGIPVFDGVLVGHITRSGELVNISSGFLPEIEHASGLDAAARTQLELAPPISAVDALISALADVGENVTPDQIELAAPASTEPDKAQILASAALMGQAQAALVWLPMSRSSVRLCWLVRLHPRGTWEAFETVVDASSGEALVRHNLTKGISNASYLVYTNDSPTPKMPGWTTPNTNQPTTVTQQWVTLSAFDTNASPNGWINDGTNYTAGNNVLASLNRGGTWPCTNYVHASTNRWFGFTVGLTNDPITYTNASVVNAFYWCNWMHDRLYQLGFTEAAGNFQQTNFSGRGAPNDPVLVFAQFGADNGNYYNSSFVQSPDGTSGWLELCVDNGPTPNRDDDLDTQTILHEYTHGLNARLAGGGWTTNNSNPLTYFESGGLDEGWADFYALSLLSQPTNDVNGCYPFAAYGSYLWGSERANYYYGCRYYPYCTDTNKSPAPLRTSLPPRSVATRESLAIRVRSS